MPWVTIADMAGGQVQTGERFLSEEGVRAAGIPWSEPGELLYSFKLSIGKTAFVHSRLVTNEAIATVKSTSRIDLGFARWVLPLAFEASASRNIYGAPILNQQQLLASRIPYPGLEEQRRIADYLDRETAEIDALIDELSSLSDLVGERQSAAVERKFLGHDFVQIRHLNPQRETGVSVNGASWQAQEGQPGVLKTGAASKGYLDVAENKAVVEVSEIARLTTPLKADRILINRANTPELVGSTAYVSNEYPNLFLSDKLWQIDFNANNEFMYYVRNSRIYRDQVSLRSVGASASMQNLSYEDFLSIELPVPDRDTQTRIADSAQKIFEDAVESKTMVQDAVALAKERRSALISAAVTGQINVTEKHAPVAEQIEAELAEAR
ncbi:Type I site-specific deoxyribonuclease [Gulosibacter molinativorax]|nr:Type I site-specific deoxyribonuclease [Gulosibacter molinativorax]